MTELELFMKVDELARDLPQDVVQLAKKIRESGAIDLDSYENNYLLPKIVLCAALRHLSGEFEPFEESARAEVVRLALYT